MCWIAAEKLVRFRVGFSVDFRCVMMSLRLEVRESGCGYVTGRSHPVVFPVDRRCFESIWRRRKDMTQKFEQSSFTFDRGSLAVVALKCSQSTNERY